VNLVTPGRLNPQQQGALAWGGGWWAVAALLLVALVVAGRIWR
jgi:hypothetical protein